MELTLTGDALPLESLYRWEREAADRVFLTQPHSGGRLRDWTWSAAALEIRRMAAHLRARNWEPGSRIGLVSKNSAWWVMADLAIWMAGHVTVPVYPSLRAASVRRILEHSEAKGCFFGATDDAEVPRLGIPAGVYRIALPSASVAGEVAWDAVMRSTDPLPESPTRPAGDLATIIYTSGTTGVPKGVMHRFAGLAFDALSLRATAGVNGEDRFISYLPLAHIVERCGLETTAILLGARIFFVEALQTFVHDLKRAHATIFLSVPRLLVKMQQGVFEKISPDKLDRGLHTPLLNRVLRHQVLSALGLGSVRLAACGAAPLPVDVLLWYRGLGLNLAEGYGMTETLITHLPKAGGVRPGYVGPPMPGVETRISAEDELLVKSPMNMMGYYKDPEGTRAAFDNDGFFRTGDVAAMDDDGQTRIIGRIKEQFKTSKGKYVVPAPIESRLAQHPAVETCCLMGAGLPNPFALVLLNGATRASAALERELEELLDAVNGELETHERVGFLAVVEGPWSVENELMTPTMKLRRGKLEQHYLAHVDGWREQGRKVVWEAARTPASPVL